MSNDESWLFAKSTAFSYATRIAMLVTGLLYNYIIANALGPTQYGIAMFVLAFIGNIVYVFGADVFYQLLCVYIPRARSRALFLFFAKVLIPIFFFMFIVFYLFSGHLLSLIGRGDAKLFSTASVLFLFFPFYLLFEALFKGLKSFGKVMIVTAIENFLSFAFAFIFVVFLGYNVSGPIYAKIISVTIGFIFYIAMFSKQKFEEKDIEFKEIKKCAKELFVSNILQRANIQAVLFYMGLFLSSATMGLYYIAEKISVYAVQIPTLALIDVIVPFASQRAKSRRDLASLVSKGLKFSLIASVTLGFFALIFAPLILNIFLPKYNEAYLLLPLFMAWLFGASLLIMANCVCTMLKRIDLSIKSSIISLIVTLVLGLALTKNFGVYGLLASQIASTYIGFVYLYLKYRILGFKIEILPNLEDLIYFLSFIIKSTKRAISAICRKKFIVFRAK
ncbi:MAG: oligosaccharide flippase family protein [Candidatus Diapherotrites archaeon]|nr:oligosaccharide flippase family protein [Candidatus Diapherotrites archaeon]